MHGGVKVYRGAASAARAYVEADRSQVDDYYLAEGSGLARRFGASPADGVQDPGVMDGDGYEPVGCWPASGDRPGAGSAPRERQRGAVRRDHGQRAEDLVAGRGARAWVAVAYDAALDGAAEQVIAWVAEHATTRVVGPRGRQVQVPVERIEAVTVTVRHSPPVPAIHTAIYTFRSARGCTPPASGVGLHTVGFRDAIEALTGIGHAVMCDPGFRSALAAAGFTLDDASGEVVELAPYVGAFSERAAQIGRHIDRYEAEWRVANPGQEPASAVRRSWDRRAWKDARPDKIVPADGAAMVAQWNQQLHDLDYRDPSPQPGLPMVVGAPRVGEFDREAAVATVLVRLGARRSAWNSADIRGEAERRSPRRGSPSTPPSASNWPRTPPPGSSRRACRCWTIRVCPSTSGP